MANSPSHKWGQIIGQQFLEVAMEPLLRTIAVKHNLFLDTKGVRSARTGAKICWADLYGNTHDLDFVIERGGTADRVGDPVAFIETAWRRYTKHSRNKAQEIQGAVLPLINTHQRHAPFFGAILAGEWTDGALNQLRSLGFRILHFQYADIIDAFRVVKIDAGFDEDTPDAECAKKVKKWEALRSPARLKVARHLLSVSEDSVSAFWRDQTRPSTPRLATLSCSFRPSA